MKKDKKQTFSQALTACQARIEIRDSEFIKNEIACAKKSATENITNFCRNKAIELLHGCSIEEERVRKVDVGEALDILKFLATLGATD